MDYCGPFTPSSKRNKYILLAICPKTKYITAQALLRATATVAAQFLVNTVVLIHGCPKEILTDRGTHFHGHVVQETLHLLDIKHLLTSEYHFQADGNAKRAPKTYETILSLYAFTNQTN